MTIRSGAIAWRLSAVSTRLSPFDSAEPEAEKLRLSADSRFSPISKVDRVRVEDSKNRLTTVLPRSVGTFLYVRDRQSTRLNSSHAHISCAVLRFIHNHPCVSARVRRWSGAACRPAPS